MTNLSPTIERTTWLYQRDANRAGHGSGGSPAVPLGTVLDGDATQVLASLPDASFDCVVTSPPYHLLRRYAAGEAELGTDTHVDDYVRRLAIICDEIARVLTPTGGLWLNLGDSFSRGPRYGATAKSLLLAPERLLLQLSQRGWIVRNKVVWAKTNPMPNSVRDRLTTTWEPIFFLVRSPRAFFDLDVIREPHTSTRPGPRPLKLSKYGDPKPSWAGPLAGKNDGLDKARAAGRPGHELGKNPGDVWRIATAASREAHFAVFPTELVRRPILAGCPERVCQRCAQPWQRDLRRDHLGGLRPGCECHVGWRAGRVLDPFIGSGTVAVVAEQLGRDWLGIELRPAFADMTRARVEAARNNTSK